MTRYATITRNMSAMLIDLCTQCSICRRPALCPEGNYPRYQESTGSDKMSEIKPKATKLTLFGVIKEIFNWYPAEYPSQERKLVLLLHSHNRWMLKWLLSRLLFKLDVSILVFACLCCKSSFFLLFHTDKANLNSLCQVSRYAYLLYSLYPEWNTT